MHDMYIRLDTTAQAVTLGGVSFAAFYACAKPYIRNMLQAGVLVRAVDGVRIRLTEVGKTEDMDALWN